MTPESEMKTTSAAPPGMEGAAIEHSAERDPTPLSTSDTHGKHFAYLTGHMTFVCLTLTAVIVAFVAGVKMSGAVAGIGLAAGVTLAAMIAVAVMASHRAAEDFFEAYAEGRGLTRYAKGILPGVTPLLRRGDRRHFKQIMFGTLPGGVEGKIAHYTYEVDTTDSDGDPETKRYDYTVMLTEVPELAVHASGIYCQPRKLLRFLDAATDKFRSQTRLELESEHFDKRFEVFFDGAETENWMHQLFTPSFIIWMAEDAPDGIGFEAVAGAVCFYTRGHFKSAEEFDDLCEASAVICKRMRDESNE